MGGGQPPTDPLPAAQLPNPSSDVFVSYASQDAAIADAVVAALERNGVACWIAPRDVTPGEFYADAIVRALNEARILVLVLTENSVTSPHVLREVERTSSKRHAIVTLRFTNSSLPPALEYFLSASHWLDATASGVDGAMPKLVAAVKRLVGPSSAANPAKPTTELFPLPPVTKQSQRLSRLVIALGALIAVVVAYLVVDKLGTMRHAAPEDLASAVPAIVDKSVAVLPFADMSEKHDQEYLSDGLSEELINMLSTVAGLRVPARTSSFAFKGKQTTLRDIAKALRVSHVLEGSVRKSGNRLRIVAQLIDARTDAHLWSQNYDRELTDVFAVQDEIAATVVAKLKVTLLGAPPKAQKTDPRAHDLYLQASHLFSLHRPGDSAKSIALVKQALAIDPDYSLAWLLLAASYIDEAGTMQRPIDDGYRLAREAVDKAIAIDPNSARVYVRLAQIEMDYDRDLASAARHIEQALALDPASVAAANVAADLAVSLGRMDLAVAMAQSVVDHDPINGGHYIAVGSVHFYAGHLDEAIASYRAALKLNPEIEAAHSTIGLALLLQGNAAQALGEIQREPSEAYRSIGLPMAFHALRQPAKSDAALGELIRRYEKDSAYNIAEVLAFRRETDRAFQWLEKAVAYRDPGLYSILTDPLFDRIHTDSRWPLFLSRMGRSPEQLAAIRFDVKPLPQ